LEQIEENEISENLLKSKDAFGNGAVHYAAAHGRTDILEKLILEGAELNAGNENKMTPLLLAVSAGHKSTLDLLLHYKADTKKKDTDDRTALHYASYCGHEDIVRELLNNNKRSVNKKDAFHQTPVHYAINASNDDIVGLLADNKGNIRSDKENLQGLLINHISGENFNIVNFLLDHNAKANGEIYGTTPLIIAAGNSSLEMVDLLLEQGASVNRSNENQISPLLSACLTGRLEVVNYLLEKDANVNVQSKSGLSAIQAAVLRNDPEMIDLLISHGVDIETEDGAGRTPFWNAAILGYRESMKTLLEAGASCNLNMKDAIGLMELAFRYDMPEAVGLALDQCLDANFLFYDKYPSTWMAEYYAADEILDLLIASGAEKNTGEALAIIPIKDLSERPRIVEHTGIYYPTDLKRKYGTRKFVVQIIIDEEGHVLFPKMIDSAIPEIDRIVMETITGWRFTIPRDASGMACSTIAQLPILLECEDIEKGTWEISEVDQMPGVIKAFPPKYPHALRVKGIQGRVVLDIIIDEAGKAEKISIESMTHKGFAESAIAAGKKYEFSPGYYQGEPVKVRVKLPIIYEFN
jgi:TonB family protein